ncbi:MAG: SIMPL domain-containing protein [Alphaproteobacteria bacterium]|nr:SIMPL domain-containing protein [Alphaproteobacteria bacterium]
MKATLAGLAGFFIALTLVPPALAAEERPVITTEGFGQVKVPADGVVITGWIELVGPSSEAVHEELANRSAAILKALRDAGVPEAQIVAPSFELDAASRRYDDPNPKIKGYWGRWSVSVDVAPADVAGTVSALLLEAGANEISNFDYFVADPEAAQAMARKAAIDQARTRAESYAEAIGKRLGTALRIDTDPDRDMRNRRAADEIVVQARKREVSLIAPPQVFSDTVYVTWELK